MSHLHGLSNTFEASRENEKIYGIARTQFPFRTRFHTRNKSKDALLNIAIVQTSILQSSTSLFSTLAIFTTQTY